MASLYRTAAAVCLVALSVLQAQAQGNSATYKFTVEKVDEDAYVAANLARNGKLPVHISGVAKADNLVSSLTDKVEAATGAADATCNALIKEDLKAVFHRSFDYSEAPNYRKLLQEALEDGLKVFDTYPKEEGAWQTIWNDDAGANVAYLLGANSTQIGCVIGKCTGEPAEPDTLNNEAGTNTTKAALFCELKPAVTANQAAFDEEYFNGLIARTTELEDMTEDDLKVSVGNGVAAAAVPTILIAGFVAMLAAVSA